MSKFGARLYGVYLAPDQRIQFCAIEPGMMRGQALVRDLRGSKHTAIDPQRILHLFTLDNFGEGSVYPFIRLRPAVEAVRAEREAVRLAANVALPPVQMPLEMKSTEFHMATGYDASRGQMLALRKVVPGLEAIRATFCFTLISSKRGNGEGEAIYCRLWKHITAGSLRKMSDKDIYEVANTATEESGTRRVTRWEAGAGPQSGLGNLLHGLWDWAEDFAKWWAAHPKLRDRELRRRGATEVGLPPGLGMAKFTFGLELLGQNVACLDLHMMGILVGRAKTPAEAKAIGAKLASDVSKRTAKPVEGSRWKGIVEKAIDLYEKFEDDLVKDNEFFKPSDPMGYARCQWMTWEVLRQEATVHDTLFSSLRSLKSDLKMSLPTHYVEHLKKMAKQRWMRLNYQWVDVAGKKPVSEKAKAFAKRAKKTTSKFKFYTPRLIANPITTKALVTGPWAEYTRVRDHADSWMRANQVPGIIRQAVLRILYKNKPPAVTPEIVGRGAFAVVVDHPHDRKLVIKLTEDALDADLASRVKYLQDKGDQDALAVFPRIHEIYEVPYTKYFGGLEEEYIVRRPPNRFWAMVIERVVPLREAAEKMMGWEGKDRLDGLVKWARHKDAMEHAGELAWALERGEVPAKQKESVRNALHKGLVEFAVALGEVAKAYKDEFKGKLSDTLSLMQDIVATLIETGFYITDLHCGNWGVRVTTGQLLVIDFGLSSTEPVGKTEKSKVVLRPKQPGAPKQLSLFSKQNPEGWTSYTKRGFCDICHREPVEVFEHRGWPTLCAECIPKWEAHVKRTAAGDELWSKYLQFRRESGKDTGFGDMARHDRAKAEFLEAFEGGKSYALKKSFEEWLKQKPKKNPLPFKVAWKVGGRWQTNSFQSRREAESFLERVKHWPGSNHHRLVDARTQAVLIMANRRRRR